MGYSRIGESRSCPTSMSDIPLAFAEESSGLKWCRLTGNGSHSQANNGHQKIQEQSWASQSECCPMAMASDIKDRHHFPASHLRPEYNLSASISVVDGRKIVCPDRLMSDSYSLAHAPRPLEKQYIINHAYEQHRISFLRSPSQYNPYNSHPQLMRVKVP